MAHVGEELGLHDVGVFGRVLGQGELRHRPLQIGVVVIQRRQQSVEVADEITKLVVGFHIDGDGEVLGLADPLHRLLEAPEGP